MYVCTSSGRGFNCGDSKEPGHIANELQERGGACRSVLDDGDPVWRMEVGVAVGN